MGLSEKAVPYTGPYSIDGNGKHSGPTAQALKRAMKRADFGFADKTFSELTGEYNKKLEQALDKWDKGANGYADGRWKKIRNLKTKKGEWALDAYAQNLIKDEHATSQTGGLDEFRGKLVEFCEKGIANGAKWSYTQGRAVKVDVDPSGSVNSDCSGSVIQAYHYAKKKTGYPAPDPAKYSWSGYGNTWDDEDGWPKVSGSYKVGDLAHYDGHVCMCMQPGDWYSSRWWSFGSEPPGERTLGYRDDFRFVVRPL